ncbi:ParA family protein [Paenibacillus sp. P96]|uniref:ParA family protein n=1 Tax=Paenibacillus zeirhizosphaerae TaxID=2987519 RepID=A0ABT9FX60_9BACL|nr:ParA family protein [Paenibacillus sp. P96]MDP4099310.1 ParA family protein [Paenibacillus sp. P96]
MGIIYAVVTNKGGVGKTSFISNLAAAMVKKLPKARVLLVDTDPKGNLAIAFGKSPAQLKHTIYNALTEEVPIQDVKIPLIERLDLIPANQRMASLTFDASPDPLYLLKSSLEEIRDPYDFIFIDTPSAIGMLMWNVLGAADRIMIPIEPETFAVAAMVQMADVIQDFQKKHRPELIIDGIVAMKVDDITALYSEMLPLARKYCHSKGLHMYDTVIPKSMQYANSVAYERRPAFLSTPKHRFIAPYGEMVREVLAHAAEKTTVS